MTYRGRIENGKVVLDEPVELPEGVAVEVAVHGPEGNISNEEVERVRFSRLEHYRDIIGIAEGLPADASENKYHYLYGGPKV